MAQCLPICLEVQKTSSGTHVSVLVGTSTRAVTLWGMKNSVNKNYKLNNRGTEKVSCNEPSSGQIGLVFIFHWFRTSFLMVTLIHITTATYRHHFNNRAPILMFYYTSFLFWDNLTFLYVHLLSNLFSCHYVGHLAYLFEH